MPSIQSQLIHNTLYMNQLNNFTLFTGCPYPSNEFTDSIQKRSNYISDTSASFLYVKPKSSLLNLNLLFLFSGKDVYIKTWFLPITFWKESSSSKSSLTHFSHIASEYLYTNFFPYHYFFLYWKKQKVYTLDFPVNDHYILYNCLLPYSSCSILSKQK